MKQIKLLYLIVISQLLALNINAQIQDLTTLIKKTDPSIIKIYTINSKGEYERQGTGVIISNDGIAITNFHVIAGAKDAEAINHLGEIVEIKSILDYSEKNDLIKIQLETNGEPTSPATYSNLNIEKGMNVFTLGFPNGFEISGGSTVSTGIISGFRVVDGQNLIQTTAPITHGSSGGGLFDMYGKLCGITTGTFATDIKDRHANLNKVIPTNDIKALTRNLNITLPELYSIISNDNLFIKAMEAYEAKSFELGIYYFLEHLQKFPDDAVAWFRLGNCYNQIGRNTYDVETLEYAVLCFDCAIDLDSSYYFAFGQASLVYLMLRNYASALEYAEKALEIAPNIQFTNYIMGKYYNEQKNYKMAIKFFTEAIILSSNNTYLHQLYLERAIARAWLGEKTLAEKDYKKCLELNNKNQDCLFYYANFLLIDHRDSEACTYLNKLYKINPTYSISGYKVSELINSYCK